MGQPSKKDKDRAARQAKQARAYGPNKISRSMRKLLDKNARKAKNRAERAPCHKMTP